MRRDVNSRTEMSLVAA